MSTLIKKKSALLMAVQEVNPLNKGLLELYSPKLLQGTTLKDRAGVRNMTLHNFAPSPALDGTLEFDGIDDRLEFNMTEFLSPNLFDQFSMSFWFKPSSSEKSVTSHRTLLMRNMVVGGYWHNITEYVHNSNFNTHMLGVSLSIGAEVSAYSTYPALSNSDEEYLNTWWHCVIVYNGADVRIYKQGALLSTGIPQALGQISYRGTYRIGGGAYNNTLASFFHGKMGEIRTYGRALNATEVAELYALGRFGG